MRTFTQSTETVVEAELGLKINKRNERKANMQLKNLEK